MALTDTARDAGTAPAPAADRLVPGALLAVAMGAGTLVASIVLPAVSPLLLAILVGVALGNSHGLPAAAQPGLTWSAKRLLRAGVVLLGLQLSLTDVVGLGPGVIVLVLAVVAGGIGSTMLIGRLLGIGWEQRLLIACGFSICGAAAAAAVDGAIEAEERETATAIALVVAFGTAMIGVVPLLAAVLGLGSHAAGLLAGASIHEVAQVVAAGGIIGGGALGVAVVVKLARVLMLAPVLAWVGWRRRTTCAGNGGTPPPLVPLFVLGFAAMVAANTWLPLPALGLNAAGRVETLLLSAAMFALGCGVRIVDLRRVGPRPVLLAASATVVVTSIALVGALLLG